MSKNPSSNSTAAVPGSSDQKRYRTFEDLEVYEAARYFRKAMYKVNRRLPDFERFELGSQIRRAAVSLTNNIAEGHGRLTDSQFRHFLGNARGSLCELQTQMELASDFGYIEKQIIHSFMEQGSEVARLINGLIATLNHGGVRTHSANSAPTEHNQ